jgi:hypothetical protein
MTDARPEIRASDTEREQIARKLQVAAEEGRLTLDEIDQRLSRLYEAKYRSELAVLVEDLPAESPTESKPGNAKPASRLGRVHPALAVHAVIVAVFGVLLIGRWIASDAPFFWPVFPMFWLGISLLVHARIRHGFGRSGQRPPWQARMT